jgi:hypothetical protein
MNYGEKPGDDYREPNLPLRDKIHKKVSVESILRALAKGDSIYDILLENKDLSTADIFACLDYAAELVASYSLSNPSLVIGERSLRLKTIFSNGS